MDRLGRALLVVPVGLWAACVSCTYSPFGVRPEIKNVGDGSEGRGEITITFEIIDKDLTWPSVALGYYSDYVWHEATIVGATAGGSQAAFEGNVALLRRAVPEWTACTVTWDSLADEVALDGLQFVDIRLTPVDFDGVGEPKVHRVAVNNEYPTLYVDTAALAFECVYASGVNPASQTVHVENRGPANTTLDWWVDAASLPPWLSATPANGTLGPDDPPASVSFGADPVGQGMEANVYEIDVVFRGKDAQGAGAHGSPFTLHVTLTVRSPRPAISIQDAGGAPVTDLHFLVPASGGDPPDQSFWVANTGDAGSVLAWTATDDLTSPDWLSYTPTSGETAAGASGEVVVSVDASGLVEGTYTAVLTVSGFEKTTGEEATGGAQLVTIHLTVGLPPALSVTPTSMSFRAQVDGANPGSQTLHISNSGDGSFDWQVSEGAGWLALSPSSGSCTTETDAVTVSVDIAGLAAGSYGATITVTAPGAANSPETAQVALAVTSGSPDPEIGLSRTTVTFAAVEGGPSPPGQTVSITNVGGAGSSLGWVVSADEPWIQLSPLGGSTVNETDTFAVSVVPDQSDVWTGPTSLAGAPEARSDHSAVWTGSEMIVWGGWNSGYLNTGSRYDPATDSWPASISTSGAPAARSRHSVVWTGSAMIVWGGSGFAREGSRYYPATNTWGGGIPTAGAPTGRCDHKAVWTGTRMVVWGGWDGTDYLDTGAFYDPATDAWTGATSLAGAPEGRYSFSAVWTGIEMIVWGGANMRRDGGRFDPVTNTWVGATALVGAPHNKSHHAAVWTGREMIVWGGSGGVPYTSYSNTGARYDPVADLWLGPTATVGSAEGRSGLTAVWTGYDMIVWGGSGLQSGGRYVPPGGFAAGTYTGVITITAPGAPNSPQSVDVTLIVAPAGSELEPVVVIEATDALAYEDSPPNTGTFTIARTGDTTAPLTVGVRTSGTAVPGGSGDYTTQPDVSGGTVTIPGGSRSVDVTVTPVLDAFTESWETAVLEVTPGTGYALGAPSSATITFEPDGVPPCPFRLIAPGNGSTDILLTADLFWGTAVDGSYYTLSVATDVGFTNPVVDGLDLTTNKYSLSNIVPAPATQYWWRVTCHNFSGSTEATGNPFTFTTAAGAGGLVGYWKFDTAHSGVAYDSSGSGNLGRLSGGPVWQLSGGRIEGALEFDGIDDHVRVDDSAILDITKNLTIAAWIKPDGVATGVRNAIVARLRDSSETQYALSTGASSATLELTYERAGNDYSLSGGTLATQWQHVAATIDGSLTIRLYVDGWEVASDTAPAETIATSERVSIGRFGGTFGSMFFDGLIDDVRIYSRALGLAEIQALAGQ